MAYTCKKCGKVFKRKSNYDRHVNKKNKCYKELKCKKCGKIFDRKFNYDRHLKNKTPCWIIKSSG